MFMVVPLAEVGRMKVQICPSDLTYPQKKLLAIRLLAMKLVLMDPASHLDHLVPYL